MSIVRVSKVESYTAIANEPLVDKRLSWAARGLLAYLLTKPDNWTVRTENLIDQSPGSRTIVRRIIKELVGAGYMTRERIRQKGGTFLWETVVYESCNHGTKPVGGLSVDGGTADGKPADIVSTELVSTKTSPNGEAAKSENGAKVKVTDDLRAYAEKIFRERTGLSPPTNKKTAGARWWSPLRDICVEAGGDLSLIRYMIEGAIDDLGMDKVYAPGSLVNVIGKFKARGLQARANPVKIDQTGGVKL